MKDNKLVFLLVIILLFSAGVLALSFFQDESYSFDVNETTEHPSAGTEGTKIVYFIDYQCPHCRDFDANSLPKLDSEYIQTGEARLVLRPVGIINNQSTQIGSLAYGIWKKDKTEYWDWHSSMMENQLFINSEEQIVRTTVENTNFTEQEVRRMINENTGQVRENNEKLGSRGTPTFIVNGTVVSGGNYREITKLLD